MLERKPLPQWLEGVWRRQGRALDGGPFEEVADVVWAQVGSYFADVRVPTADIRTLASLDEAQAFSGKLTYCEPTATWRHDLDTNGRPSGYEDTAELQSARSGLLEIGTGYSERWQREPRRHPTAVVERRGPTGVILGRIVMVADLGVAVWGVRQRGGATVRFEGGGWEVVDYVGTGPIPWAAVHDARSGRASPGWQRVA